jgi:TolA-binding protein
MIDLTSSSKWGGMARFALIIIFSLLCLPFQAFAFDETTREFSQAEKQFQAGNYLMAERNYRESLDKYKDIKRLSAYIHNRIGECLQYQGKTEDAVTIFRKIQTDYPESPLAAEAQEKITRAYYSKGNFAKAAPEFEKLGNQSDKNAAKAGVSAAATGNSGNIDAANSA